MDIHAVICRAADHIEQHPKSFEFTNAVIPRDFGNSGCALGWIGYFSGEFVNDGARSSYVDDVAAALLQVPAIHAPLAAQRFYGRLGKITGGDEYSDAWMDDAALCAKGMRAYADEYHPKAAHSIPADVRAILDDVHAAAVSV